MLYYKTIGYTYKDISIVPSCISSIVSRSECDVLNNDVLPWKRTLPIFASPMSTITNQLNFNLWENNNIIPILPRNIHANTNNRILNIKFYMDSEYWVALSLSEFIDCFVNKTYQSNEYESVPAKSKTYRICIDLANGHMKYLYDNINKAKQIAKENGYTLIIMTGNIANPETFKWICENADVDYIRLSIGTGNNCITSTQTGIHFPIVSLIEKCVKYKKTFNNKKTPYIIADGGIRNYSDIIKAIGLGADYVMVGSLFTGLLESAAPLILSNKNYSISDNGDIKDISPYNINSSFYELSPEQFETFNLYDENCDDKKREFIRKNKDIQKLSYGMSTKYAQELINSCSTKKTSEGCLKTITVSETIKQWTNNMEAYFKSAMSYTNKRNINEFKGNVDYIINSVNSTLAINK